jgi:UDP-N-acetylglucosamine 4,6-dehydratase/5-epimerase
MPTGFFEDKVILITGGSGSFGRAFVKTALADFSPRSIRVFSRDELKQFDMAQSITDDRLRFLIGDIRDRDRLARAMQGVDIVIHAAALKQVVAAEYNPIEAVRTNIDGAVNVIDAAIDARVDRVLGISTDKAVRPVNLYGATKLAMERVLVQSNAYAAATGTKISCVRYGNVSGSRGSVVPVWREQRNNGNISLTHPDMTRFWITLKQGVDFVSSSIEMMGGGEVFIPKIPSVRMTDLAEVVAPGCDINVTGIRPGEKLHEQLVSPEESRHSYDLGDRYLIEPEFSWWGSTGMNGTPVADDFSYSSDTNDDWLTGPALQQAVND